MGDKHSNKNKNGKKLTKKEIKAQNHLKLMQGKKEQSGTDNVIAFHQDKDKKAA